MKPENRYLLSALTPSVLIALTAMIWSAWLLHVVPDPMAIHFGADGNADGFLSPRVNFLLLSGLSIAMILGFWVMNRAGMKHGSAARFNAGMLGFVVALLSTLQIQLFTSQVDLADARSATLGGGGLLLAFALAALVALVTGLLATPISPPHHQDMAVPTMSVPKQGTAVWVKTSTMHPGIQALLVVAIVAAVISAIVMNQTWMYVIVVATIVPIIGCWSWKLKVDSRGFSYRSPLGIPRGIISHEEIKKAEPIEIKPGDWGGWGWRKNGSGTGLITRSGEGIRITRSNGTYVEASCKDAPTATALLKHFHH